RLSATWAAERHTVEELASKGLTVQGSILPPRPGAQARSHECASSCHVPFSGLVVQGAFPSAARDGLPEGAGGRYAPFQAPQATAQLRLGHGPERPFRRLGALPPHLAHPQRAPRLPGRVEDEVPAPMVPGRFLLDRGRDPLAPGFINEVSHLHSFHAPIGASGRSPRLSPVHDSFGLADPSSSRSSASSSCSSLRSASSALKARSCACRIGSSRLARPGTKSAK